MSQPLSDQDRFAVLHFLEQLTLEAAELSRRSYAVERKAADNSPVTELDRLINGRIVDFLTARFPGHSVVAEESLERAPRQPAGPVWYVDPLDGTESFVRGLDEWALHVGFVTENRSVFGFVAPARQGRMYWGIRGGGAFVKDLSGGRVDSLRVQPAATIEQLRILESRFHGSKRVRAIAQELGIADLQPMGGLGLKMTTIATGQADLYFHLSAQCSLWDVCAPEVILTEAGGSLLTFSGQPIDYYRTSPFKVGTGFLATSGGRAAAAVFERVRREYEKYKMGGA
jgi:3'(2'), 5'-bisphosphate nucleotidase